MAGTKKKELIAVFKEEGFYLDFEESRAKPYEVVVGIDPLPKKKWEAILKDHSHSIESMEALAEGSFPRELEETFFMRGMVCFRDLGRLQTEM